MGKKTEKLPGAHGRIKRSYGRKKNGKYFADFVPKSIPTLWAKARVNTRHFFKEYAFACKGTVVFIFIALLAVIIRYSQQASLAQLLATVTTVTQDYNSLVSSTSLAGAESNSSSSDIDGATTPTGTVSSTSFDFSQDTNTAQDQGSSDNTNGSNNGNSGGGNGDGGGNNNEPPPPPPFSSAIGSFDLLNPDGTISCNGVINITNRNCTKTYNFSSTVNTQNGPGQVNYGWLTDVSGGNSNGQYTASEGQQSQSLSRSVVISCRNEGSYTMRFIISAPNSVQSSPININHVCG